MKRLFAIVLFCVLVPCAYGETINYSDGGKYVGEVSNGVRHGQGSYTYADGRRKYVGEWKDGKRHGQGTFTDNNEKLFLQNSKTAFYRDSSICRSVPLSCCQSSRFTKSSVLVTRDLTSIFQSRMSV